MSFEKISINTDKKIKKPQNIEVVEELEIRRKRVQRDLRESLTRLRKLSNVRMVSPQIQGALIKEVMRLEGKEKDIEYLYDAYKNAKEEARKDPLTNLLNRRAFEEVLNIKIERAGKNDKTSLYVLCIDIDKFKEVNDTFGHMAGDDYLRLISHHVMTQLRPDDTLARIGGDEFAVALFFRSHREESGEQIDHDGEAESIVSRVYHAVYNAKSELYEKLSSSGKDTSKIDSSRDIASIGYVRFDGKQQVTELMEEADKTMYEVKRSGESGVKRSS